jgi:sugar (pentulose or hexulose) kinase
MEGIAAQYAKGLLSLEQLFPELISESITAIGGAAKDEVFTGIKANFTQKNYRIRTDFNASLRGSALIAGIGAGIFSLENLPELPKQKSAQSTDPHPEEKAVYEKMRSLYTRMEEKTLVESFSQLAGFPGNRS